MTELIAGIFTVAVLGTTIWLCRGLRLTSRDICLAGLMSAATLVLRCFLITLPNGSHISLGAMLPILLLSLIHRPQVAFCAGWVTGVLAMLLLPEWQPVHWAQPFVEQLICFSALGYAGIFGTDRRWKIVAGTPLAPAISWPGPSSSPSTPGTATAPGPTAFSPTSPATEPRGWPPSSSSRSSPSPGCAGP